MSPRGAMPKPPGQRVRRHRDPAPQRVLDVVAVPQPPLPDDVLAEGETWHPLTRRWWSAWGDSPITDAWDELVWHELTIAALLHHRHLTTGSAAAATELRLRLSKLGAAPDDRLRLRITTAEADRRDAQQAKATPGAAARTRYGRPQAVPDITTDHERGTDDHHDDHDTHDAPLDAG